MSFPFFPEQKFSPPRSKGLREDPFCVEKDVFFSRKIPQTSGAFLPSETT